MRVYALAILTMLFVQAAGLATQSLRGDDVGDGPGARILRAFPALRRLVHAFRSMARSTHEVPLAAQACADYPKCLNVEKGVKKGEFLIYNGGLTKVECARKVVVVENLMEERFSASLSEGRLQRNPREMGKKCTPDQKYALDACRFQRTGPLYYCGLNGIWVDVELKGIFWEFKLGTEDGPMGTWVSQTKISRPKSVDICGSGRVGVGDLVWVQGESTKNESTEKKPLIAEVTEKTAEAFTCHYTIVDENGKNKKKISARQNEIKGKAGNGVTDWPDCDGYEVSPSVQVRGVQWVYNSQEKKPQQRDIGKDGSWLMRDYVVSESKGFHTPWVTVNITNPFGDGTQFKVGWIEYEKTHVELRCDSTGPTKRGAIRREMIVQDGMTEMTYEINPGREYRDAFKDRICSIQAFVQVTSTAGKGTKLLKSSTCIRITGSEFEVNGHSYNHAPYSLTEAQWATIEKQRKSCTAR